ncbi:potassium transporter [Sinimarinibacterium sp. CAU 1509]|uniref:TrkH family potassium uptake protein n=1 Tax=Sinimarinibacterium sp. CAU 1509 TaxID=2562283 RepID=UPI0010AD17AE|nr:TrkH family potassium uptake protein [Sinimarinibacterium sp. CAU 1509]TJY59933.1 potassium transporter [Sinimarinibacterium sp. CAU 1509]
MARVAAIPRASSAHRYAAVQKVSGMLLMLFSITMLPPLLISSILEEGVSDAFLDASWITLTAGALVWWPVRRLNVELKTRDGFLVVVLFWLVLSIFGAIPLYVTHTGWVSFVDAMFESASGLTTTGATVASGLDSMPKAILFYRVQLHWLGGMGVIVLAVALLPMLGIGGMQLYRAETPGPMKDSKLTPRIASTARALWIIYLTLTVVCGLTYWLLGMTFFDAVCHAMSTISTGGFSTHDASIGHYQSLPIEIAVMVFMLAGAMNFALHFMAFRSRSILTYFRDTEFRAFLIIVAVFGLLVSIPLWWSGTYDSLGTAIRIGLFQVISFGTTAGFATADPTPWPGFVPLLVLLSGFLVGCAGSTSGGIKVTRVVMVVKQISREMQRLLHPSATIPLKLGGKSVPDEIVYAVAAFFSVYVGLTILLTLVMIGTGLDPVTALSAVAACINNEGPGLGPLNATMASVSDFGKWVLILTMLIGRLEIFTVLIIFTPGFWRR